MSGCLISAYPVRIIPFDLGRSVSADDLALIEKQLQPKYRDGVADKKLDSRRRQLNVHKRAGRNGAPRI